MKYLTNKISASENEDNDIFDICQELTDIGWQVIIGNSWFLVRNIKHPLCWSELRDYALRLKDYLGDKFKSINITAVSNISEHGYITSLPKRFEDVELDENTEIGGFIQIFKINLNEDRILPLLESNKIFESFDVGEVKEKKTEFYNLNTSTNLSESKKIKKKPRKLKRYKEFVKRKPITNLPCQWVPISNKNSPEPLLNNIPMASTVD